MWQTVSPYIELQIGRKIADSTKNLSSKQLSNNILEQVYKSQLLVNLNANEL
jgi:hypothetical protein